MSGEEPCSHFLLLLKPGVRPTPGGQDGVLTTPQDSAIALTVAW